MSIFSKNFPSDKKCYTPWTAEYFAAAISERNALIQQEAIMTYNSYEILKTIEGGMSEVKIARKTSTKELCALKSIKPGSVLDKNSKILIAEEASKTIGMSVSNLLVPEDVLWDYDRGACILVFPYCAGGTLRDRSLTSNLPIDEIIFYALSTALGLADLHDNKYLHLDLKPNNIFLECRVEDDQRSWWRLVISDLGIAREIKKSKATKSSSGTIAFMSPEQFIDEPVTFASDIWGFGTTFYTIMTGRLPFGANGCFDERSRSFISHIDTPHVLRSDCPDWLSDIIMKCLEINPKDRYQNFDQVLSEILQRIRVEDSLKEGSLKSYAGAARDTAQMIIYDFYVLDGLANRNMAENVYTGKFTLGWLKILNEASKLYDTHSAGPTRKALQKVDLILGLWDDPESPISQFFRDPDQKKYEFEKYWGRRRDKSKCHVWSEFNLPVTPGTIRELLNLRCMCLITLVEELAIPGDLKCLEDTASRWMSSNSFGHNYKEWENIKITFGLEKNKTDVSGNKSIHIGPPRELCLGRIAQGLRHAGKFQQAHDILSDAIKTWPDHHMLLMALFLTCCDMGNYKDAMVNAYVGLEYAKRQNDYSWRLRWSHMISEYFLDTGKIEPSINILEMLVEQTKSPTFQILLCRNRARKTKSASKSDFEFVYPYAQKAGQLTPWMVAAEVAYYADMKDVARKIAEYLLTDPRMYLPIWKTSYEFACKIALGTL